MNCYKKKFLFYLFYVFLIQILFSDGFDMYNRLNEWFSVPASTENYQKISCGIFEILENNDETSKDLLATETYHVLEFEYAEQLCGKKLERKGTYILCRGVAYNKNFNDFFILSDGLNLLIGHASLGSSRIVYKFPLIVNVDFLPESVYCACIQAK